MSDIFEKAELVGGLGLDELEKYFRNPNPPKALVARAGVGLKAISEYSKLRQTRAREFQSSVRLAELMGLKSEALAPIWKRLNGTDSEKFMEQEAS